MTEFKPFPKMARLSRDVVVTEKLDGTNAQIMIADTHGLDPEFVLFEENGMGMVAGSRTRWIKPDADNFGFAGWVQHNAEELMKLGEGQHFGEWWGKGIQRGYDLEEKRFSLFNTHRWSNPEVRPKCCDVVPVLHQGEFDTALIDFLLLSLKQKGSYAAPGYMNPEGVVVFHTHSGQLFKKTLDHNDTHKWEVNDVHQ